MYFTVPSPPYYGYPQYNYCPCCGKPTGAQPLPGYSGGASPMHPLTGGVGTANLAGSFTS